MQFVLFLLRLPLVLTDHRAKNRIFLILLHEKKTPNLKLPGEELPRRRLRGTVKHTREETALIASQKRAQKC